MTFPREFPLGVPALQVISPTNFENWDIRISQAVDGTGGGVYAGAIELTGALLSGTSAIDTDGNLTTTGDVTAANFIGTQTVSSDEVVAVASFATTSLPYRTSPRAVGSQTIDTSTGAVLALDFTTRDTWEITLNNGADPNEPAVLGTTATLTDTAGVGDPAEVKPGMKITVTFKAGAAQVGGIGISPSATVFPASFHGLTKADLVGPRSGANGVGGGTNDWMRLELENIGTAATPKYACKMTMGVG